MKILNDIVDWSISSGALVAAILFAWKYIKPWLDNKTLAEQSKNSMIGWKMIDQVATMAVESLVSQDMTGKDKFDLATKNVQVAMDRAGFDVAKSAAETAVQAAYEKSDLTPTVEINKEDK